MRKRLLALTLSVFMLLLSIPVWADELPSEFWPVNDRYAAALDAGDDWGIINNGWEAISIVENLPETDQILDIMGSRLDQIGLAYERQGDFISAGHCYERYIPYAQKKGWADGVKIAKAKVLQYLPKIEIYTDAPESPLYYGAKNEPRSGVLYGASSDGAVHKELPNESMMLMYIEFGETNLWWLNTNLTEAQSLGIALEVAWNLPGQGDQVASVLAQEEYIKTVLTAIGQYPDVPVFLRFGAEMNIWDRRAEPEAFKNAFRLVSTLAKTYAPNAAMVWSVNQVSSWDINMDDYYPGDEYVDWVGVSAYMQKYFLGRNDWPQNETYNEVVFLTGNNADPVLALTEVMERYGTRKPIMLAESGVSHTIRTLGENATDWALRGLDEMYYNIPMVYPQVKLISYFDTVIEHETNDYALSTNAAMLSRYKTLTQLPHFIQDSPSAPVGRSYQKVAENATFSGSVPLYGYVHVYGADDVTLEYYIDGQLVSSQSAIPYAAALDVSAFGEGSHTLMARAVKDGQVIVEKSIPINVQGKPVTVLLNGAPLEFDQPPVIENGRTLVPLRKIFESLGATVSWDGNTQTVMAQKGDVTVTMQIGNSSYTVNGKALTLDVPAKILGGRTLVPVRAVSESFSCQVGWDGDSRTVTIVAE